MKPIYIFRHLAHEGPGYFAEVLERYAIPHRLIAIDLGEAVPDDIHGASALAFMGGSMSVNDALPWIEREMTLIRQARQIDMPVIGHCLGGQLIAKALGGVVTANATREVGWHDVEKTAQGRRSEWLHDLPETFEVFHWHGETCSLPEGATSLLTNPWCANQAFAIGNSLAMQCHIEMTAPMVRDWCQSGADYLYPTSASVQGAEQILEKLDERVAALHRIADVIYAHWLRPLL